MKDISDLGHSSASTDTWTSIFAWPHAAPTLWYPDQVPARHQSRGARPKPASQLRWAAKAHLSTPSRQRTTRFAGAPLGPRITDISCLPACYCCLGQNADRCLGCLGSKAWLAGWQQRWQPRVKRLWCQPAGRRVQPKRGTSSKSLNLDWLNAWFTLSNYTKMTRITRKLKCEHVFYNGTQLELWATMLDDRSYLEWLLDHWPTLSQVLALGCPTA